MAKDQAAQAGDDPTSEDEGQFESTASIVDPASKPPEKPEDETQSKEEKSEEKKENLSNEEAEKWRKSDKEWQEMAEAAKKGEKAAEFMDKFQDFFKPEEGKEDEEPDPMEFMEKLSGEMSKLRNESARKDFEIENPVVREEKYKEAWEKVNTEDKYEKLSFEEKMSLVVKEDSSNLKKELTEQASARSGSQPKSSGGAPSKPEVDPEMVKLLRMGGVTNAEEVLNRYVVEKGVLSAE